MRATSVWQIGCAIFTDRPTQPASSGKWQVSLDLILNTVPYVQLMVLYSGTRAYSPGAPVSPSQQKPTIVARFHFNACPQENLNKIEYNVQDILDSVGTHRLKALWFLVGFLASCPFLP